jgi:hypothetical protein
VYKGERTVVLDPRLDIDPDRAGTIPAETYASYLRQLRQDFPVVEVRCSDEALEHWRLPEGWDMPRVRVKSLPEERARKCSLPRYKRAELAARYESALPPVNTVYGVRQQDRPCRFCGISEFFLAKRPVGVENRQEVICHCQGGQHRPVWLVSFSPRHPSLTP